jgi:hypothetical protein
MHCRSWLHALKVVAILAFTAACGLRASSAVESNQAVATADHRP